MASYFLEHQGARYHVGDSELSIGRALDATVPVDDAMVSRRHARVFRQGQDIVIEDLGSSNGTFVNAERLIGRRVLTRGDVVTVGEVTLHVGTSDEDAPASVPPGIELLERFGEPLRTAQPPAIVTRRELSSLVVLESIVRTVEPRSDLAQIAGMVENSLGHLLDSATRRAEPLTSEEVERVVGVAVRVAQWFRDGSRAAWCAEVERRARSSIG